MGVILPKDIPDPKDLAIEGECQGMSDCFYFFLPSTTELREVHIAWAMNGPRRVRGFTSRACIHQIGVYRGNQFIEY